MLAMFSMLVLVVSGVESNQETEEDASFLIQGARSIKVHVDQNLSAPQMCKAGILNKKGTHCCAASCDVCGGEGCGGRLGGAEQCCVGQFADNICANDDSVACKLPTPPPMWCKHGILNKKSTHCCPESCGTCGGEGCGSQPGGAGQCCVGHIGNNTCADDDSVACKLPEQPHWFCKHGILNKKSTHCCPDSCGTCGGEGCGSRLGGAGQCCVGHIGSKTCADDDSVACKLPTPPPMWCKHGIVNKKRSHCCPESCGECGGEGCGSRPGGAGQCCVGHIGNNTCADDGSVACKLPEEPQKVWCKNGILNPKNDTCCSASCGTCGGEGCGGRDGGASTCCVSHITDECGDEDSVVCKLPPLEAAKRIKAHAADHLQNLGGVQNLSAPQMCKAGILNKKGTHCCAASCDVCGGEGCGGRDGGAGQCCVGQFADNICANDDSVACKLPTPP